ncbi:ribosomal protein S18-alanine N-acetyltransferase [Asanoa sp. NPDC050611]|uniref:ribosomal protein S18-alanine N-acetyltransferase n=1 Tax=Asanoa sp. NPDC050611 TaxID=3157098 RepID=UPI00340B1BFB
MTVTLSRLRWWHIAALLPIEQDLFGDEKWSAGMFWNELSSGHFYLVAEDGDQIVGYGGLAVNGDEAWIQNIAVRRDAQRRGIGRRMLEALLAEAERQHARAVLLEVAVDNAPAQKLYATYGFEPIGVRRGYYQPSNTDALVMRRD